MAHPLVRASRWALLLAPLAGTPARRALRRGDLQPPGRARRAARVGAQDARRSTGGDAPQRRAGEARRRPRGRRRPLAELTVARANDARGSTIWWPSTASSPSSAAWGRAWRRWPAERLFEALAETRARLEELRRQQARRGSPPRQFRELAAQFQKLVERRPAQGDHAGQPDGAGAQQRRALRLQPDYDSAVGKKTLAEVARPPGMPERRFQVAGHTNNVQIQTPTSLQLGAVHGARGRGVEALVGLEMDLAQPLRRRLWRFCAGANDTPDGRARNRRIEITLVPNLEELVGVERAAPPLTLRRRPGAESDPDHRGRTRPSCRRGLRVRSPLRSPPPLRFDPRCRPHGRGDQRHRRGDPRGDEAGSRHRSAPRSPRGWLIRWGSTPARWPPAGRGGSKAPRSLDPLSGEGVATPGGGLRRGLPRSRHHPARRWARRALHEVRAPRRAAPLDEHLHRPGPRRRLRDADAGLRALGRQQAPREPLGNGVPFLIKDEFDVGGLPTTLGVRCQPQPAAERDATIVARLRAAGGVFVCKTALTEWGMSPIGNNVNFPMPHNAHDAAKAPGGSSSGSAVGVALGVAPLALGGDGGGSIRIPASLNGVFGIKATFGRVSRAGDGFKGTVAHAGPLAASTADLATFLDLAASSPDPADDELTAWAPPPPEGGSYGALLGAGVRRGLRIGIDEADWRDAGRPDNASRTAGPAIAGARGRHPGGHQPAHRAPRPPRVGLLDHRPRGAGRSTAASGSTSGRSSATISASTSPSSRPA